MATGQDIVLGIIGMVSMVGWIGALGLTIWSYSSRRQSVTRWRKASFGLLASLLVVFMAVMFVIESHKPQAAPSYVVKELP